MKRLLFLSLIFNVYNSTSQTLTSTNSNPVVGEVYRYAGGPYLAPGTAGAGQVWNFSSLSHTSTPIAYTWVIPTTLPGSIAFSSATIARQKFGTINEFFLLSTNGIENLGNFGTGSSVPPLTYSNSERIMTYPLSIGTASLDFWARSDGWSGSTNITADGTGTLLIGVATYTNVLRVKTVQISTNSGPGGQSNNEETYSWYVPGMHGSVLSIYSGTFTSTGNTIYDKYSIIYSDPNNPLGLPSNNSNDQDFSFYPNPATDYLFLRNNSENRSGEISIMIFDNQGKSVFSAMMMLSKEQGVDISFLNSGIYFIRFMGNKTYSTQKIIIMK